MPEDSPKSIVAERYTVEKEIGRGGMGVVLKAHDKTLDITVAIKILGKDPTGQGAARLQREATAAGKLKHQNIARVFDFGQTTDSTPYMVMEFLKGQTLADLIQEKGKLDCKTAIPIFAQVASAMAYAHNNGVIHRDIKPSNVLLLDLRQLPSQVKLLDFGVASIVNENQHLTHTGAIVGSPLYMSSEQTLGEEATVSSDIYSFGCLMFETLTGQVPFKGSSALETMSMHRSSAPPLLTDLISVQMLPSDIVLLVDECLRKNPQNRPANFALVLDRLKAIQESMENKTLSADLIQKISNQHFKIRLHQFWKSKFGVITLVASLLVLTGLAISMFQSKERQIEDAKIVPKDRSIANPVSDLLSIENNLDKSFNYFTTAQGVNVHSTEQSKDADANELKGKKIEKAIFEHGNFDGSALKYLTSKSITTITFHNSNVKDENLKYLEPLKGNLLYLEIESPYLSNKGLKEISKARKIRELYVKSDLITNEGIKYLACLPDLDHLQINSSGITDGVDTFLAKLPKLRRVHLINSSIGPDIAVKLAKLDKLETLDLSGSKAISQKSFEAISRYMNNLRELLLRDTKLDKYSFKSIAKSKSIFRLVLSNAKYNPQGIAELKSMSNLKMLNFDDSENITDELIENIVQLDQITQISFNESNLTEKQLLKLTHLRNLESVSLLEMKIPKDTHKLFLETYARIWKHPCNLVINQ